jgi:hypothetical protein
MKKTALCLALAISAAPFAVAGEVTPGASLAEVRATMGTPKGQMHMNGRQVLYYERGAVELQAGRVIQVALRSPEEHAIVVAREERMRTEREAQRARLMAEGIEVRDRKLADASFLATPLAYQVSYWENFARSYPGVSCAEPLTIARVRFNEQLEDKRRREAEAGRLAEITERRLAAAEREPVFYPIRTYSSYYGRRQYRELGFSPITYTFYDAPLPVYTTPTTPLIKPFSGDLAQPERRSHKGSGQQDWSKDRMRDDCGSWREVEIGRGRRAGRM